MPPSINHVACEARVSVATVSRFINAPDHVSPPASRRIAQAMKRLGFIARSNRPGPKPAARRGLRTGIITFLCLGTMARRDITRLPAFPQLLEGIRAALAVRTLELRLLRWSGEGPLPPQLDPRHTDGVLAFDTIDREAPELLAALDGLPTVWVLRRSLDHELRHDHVSYDNRAIGPLAARHLTGLGHRHLAFLNTEPSHDGFRERREGFAVQLAAMGASVAIFEGDVPMAALVRRALAHQPRPSAWFLPCDDQLAAVVTALERTGQEPGGTIALMGVNNDHAFIDPLRPRPDTIDINLALIGKRAAEQLLLRVREPASPRCQLLVTPSLVAGTWGR